MSVPAPITAPSAVVACFSFQDTQSSTLITLLRSAKEDALVSTISLIRPTSSPWTSERPLPEFSCWSSLG